MEQETRVAYGPVPHSLFGDGLDEASWQLADEQFLLRGERQHYFHYRKGLGITIERGEGADLSEESLWLNGSVYAAIASLNALLPLHASAVAVGEAVFAFAGPAGAGKSTLIAALGDHGFPMFCDDTLVLDLSDPGHILCLPGHKRLKLSAEALELTGARGEEKVSEVVDKYYACPAAGEVDRPLSLHQLIFLVESSNLSIEPVRGAERFRLIQDEHYTARLFASARQFDRRRQFEHLVMLARQISMSRFLRPRDRSCFAEGVELVVRHMTEQMGCQADGLSEPRRA
jgi:hypothetical protein